MKSRYVRCLFSTLRFEGYFVFIFRSFNQLDYHWLLNTDTFKCLGGRGVFVVYLAIYIDGILVIIDVIVFVLGVAFCNRVAV